MFITAITNGQSVINDSTVYQQAKSNVDTIFQHALKNNIGLYNGYEYFYSGHNVAGFPYFKSADILKGSVLYNGNLYNNISMRFDLTTNDLVIQDYTNNYPILLLKSKIDYFIIDSSLFVNGNGNYSIPWPATDGFYEVLYKDETMVFARKEKKLALTYKIQENDSHYNDFNWYYIYINNKVIKIDKEADVLNALSDKKNDLKKFIRNNNLKFKRDFENAIIKTVAYYDELKR